MGKLDRFDLNRIIKDFDTAYFVETGTCLGDGVSYASLFPFKKIYSLEIMADLAIKARNRFELKSNISIVQSDSVSGLRQILPGIKRNIVFWLDAHFPGADAGLNSYTITNSETLRLPLQQEIETICSLRKGFNDVFLMDDLRIYEDGNYQNGNVPPDARPSNERDINFVTENFSKTHFIFRCYNDEGYILLFPKRKYNRAHFEFKNLFRKKSHKEDYYLLI